jgi:septal ring factor EnvC (AmiA/AmiB activator)
MTDPWKTPETLAAEARLDRAIAHLEGALTKAKQADDATRAAESAEDESDRTFLRDAW